MTTTIAVRVLPELREDLTELSAESQEASTPAARQPFDGIMLAELRDTMAIF